jgi:ring-1,2-phenylacetyl-CoA epoxidase subunit PaaE
MSVHFHALKVKEVRRETPECVSIAFEVPRDLEETFTYKHGQYLTLKCYIDGSEVRRSYSVCSSPLDKELRIAVKKVEGGVFSTFACERLHPNDVLEVMPPMGHFFTHLNEKNKKSYAAFAAGSGITPILSIIKTTLLTEPESRFTLIYGNRNRGSIIFREELQALKNRFTDRFLIIYILSREKIDSPINFGKIDPEKCEALFKNIIDAKNTDEFFLCGPEEMIFLVKNFLENKGIAEEKIHFELFTTPNIKKQIFRDKKINPLIKAKSKITIKLDGIAFDFDLSYNGESILETALSQGADLPFACKGGVCSTCKAKLIEGEVYMDANYALEAEEIQSGFILTCQSHPQSEKVVIDFDFK